MGAQGKGIEILEDRYEPQPLISSLSLISLKGPLSHLQEFKYLKTPLSVGYHILMRGDLIASIIVLLIHEIFV